MSRKLRSKKTLSSFGHWLVRKDISLTDFAKQAGLAYRTVWLAAHGYRISFMTAEKVLNCVEEVQPKRHGIIKEELCATSTKSRKDIIPTME